MICIDTVAIHYNNCNHQHRQISTVVSKLITCNYQEAIGMTTLYPYMVYTTKMFDHQHLYHHSYTELIYPYKAIFLKNHKYKRDHIVRWSLVDQCW